MRAGNVNNSRRRRLHLQEQHKNVHDREGRIGCTSFRFQARFSYCVTRKIERRGGGEGNANNGSSVRMCKDRVPPKLNLIQWSSDVPSMSRGLCCIAMAGGTYAVRMGSDIE